MKKLLVLVLAAMLLSSFCMVCADEAKEITFQGIPWESSLEETAEALIASELIAEQAEMQYIGGGLLPFFNENGPIFIAEMNKIKDTLKPEATPVYAIEPQNYTIAGYPAVYIAFNYAFDGENAKLITVYVLLEKPKGMRKDEMYTDLALKMGQVYGEGVEAYGICTFSSGKTFLSMGADFTGMPGIMLCYADGDGYALAAEASRNYADTPQ